MPEIDDNSVLEDEANVYGNEAEPGELTKKDNDKKTGSKK
jgi:hypothetical protein